MRFITEDGEVAINPRHIVKAGHKARFANGLYRLTWSFRVYTEDGEFIIAQYDSERKRDSAFDEVADFLESISQKTRSKSKIRPNP